MDIRRLRKELSDRAHSEMRYFANFVRALAHPNEYTEFLPDGTIRPYRVEEKQQIRQYRGLGMSFVSLGYL